MSFAAADKIPWPATMSAIRTCRTCMSRLTGGRRYCSLTAYDSNVDPQVKDKLTACVPELVLDTVLDPVICFVCLAELNVAYEFKRKCLETEQRMAKCIDEKSDSRLAEFPTIKIERDETHIIDVFKTEPEDETIEEVMPTIEDNSIYLTESYPSVFESENVPIDYCMARSEFKYSRPVFECPVCNKTYRFRKCLETHMRLHEVKTHRCLICYSSFLTSSILKEHMKTHVKDGVFKCNLCEKACNGRHVRLRTMAVRNLCSICKLNFVSDCDLKMHYEAYHDNQKLYKCTVCNRKYSNLATLQKHMDRATIWNCVQCGTEFHSKFHLGLHNSMNHN